MIIPLDTAGPSCPLPRSPERERPVAGRRTAGRVLRAAAAALVTTDERRPPEELGRRYESSLRQVLRESESWVLLRNPADDFVRVSEPSGTNRSTPPAQLSSHEVEVLLQSLDGAGTAIGRAGAEADPFVSRLARRLNLAWLLVTPIRCEGKTIGIQLIGSERGAPPSAHVRRGAEEAADLAGLAIGSARLRIEHQRLERTRSEILSMVSHELRSPLHVILGYESILRGGELGELTEEQHDALVRIGRNARQLAGLIENTLTAGRDDAQRLRVGMRETHPLEVTCDIQEEMASLYGDRDLEILWDVPESLPRLYTDPDKLKVILRNLVANAVKFTDRGTIRIRARRRTNGLAVAVSDTGIGIPPDQLDAIFEEFRQAPSEDGRERGGVGLGLYIVRRMAEKLEGTIRVESTPGTGSTFTLWLPLRIGAVHAAA